MLFPREGGFFCSGILIRIPNRLSTYVPHMYTMSLGTIYRTSKEQCQQQAGRQALQRPLHAKLSRLDGVAPNAKPKMIQCGGVLHLKHHY